MEQDLTQGRVAGTLLKFAVPVFGANLLQSLYGTVDLMIVGRFCDAAAVSGVSTGSMTMQTITGIITGLTMGCTVLLGQNVGRRDFRAAARTVASALALFAALGLVLAFGIFAAAGLLAGWMNAPDEALGDTVGYIRICGAGCIFIFFFNAISGIFRGLGDSRTPLILMGIACACNIAGDLVLVGLAGLGCSGAALATVAAQAVSVLCAFGLMARRGFGFETEPGTLRPAGRELGQILRFGTPIAAQEALTGLSFAVILAILNGFGLTASAAVGVAEKIGGLVFLVPGALMSALSAFCAQNVGAGRPDRARQGMVTGIAVSVAVGLAVFAVTFFRGAWLAGFFTSDAAVCAACADYLRSYSIDCVIVGFNFGMMGYLNGNGRTGFVALQGIASTFLVRIPVSYLMSRTEGVSLFQVGFATPAATLFAIVITAVYLGRFERRQKKHI